MIILISRLAYGKVRKKVFETLKITKNEQAKVGVRLKIDGALSKLTAIS